MKKLYKDKEWFYKKYITEECSMKEIAKICKVSNTTIRYWLIKHGFELRSKSEVMKIMFKKGYISPMKNKIFSLEHRKKLSESHLGKEPWNKGKPHTIESKKKISDANKGKEPWNKGKIGCFSLETLKKMSKSHKDKPFSDLHRKHISEALKDDKHPFWKGDEATPTAIHIWVAKNKPKSEDGKCELCDKLFDKKNIKKLELSFIDHNKEYTRNIDDYQWAHHSCHMNYDKIHGFLKHKQIKNIFKSQIIENMVINNE